MKKEVVHVPTRELAEEVLRVAKENGLYEFTTSLDEMIRDSGFLLDISFESETYCELSEYEKNNCKIITAEEFLNRYKDSELEQLRKENAYLEECIGLEKRDKESLEREIYQLKEQLKAIEDQPKVGDVCLFWDEGDMTGFYVDILIKVMDNSHYKYRIRNGAYANCIKATNENIQAKIKDIYK